VTKQNRSMLVGLALLLAGTTAGLQARQDPAARPVVMPAKVDVVISRFQADKKISSLPYSLMVNVNGRPTNVRMGVDVPIGTSTTSRDGVTTTENRYRNIGTNIDCSATSRPDGRFEVSINVNDSSVAGGDFKARPQDPMAFLTLTTSNYLTLRDGQTVQFTMATDKVTGEVVKVDVTLTLVK
jgi:hypothetical protein